MPSIGIIALVPDQWSAMWQVRHHLLSRMAARCHVAWINPGHHWRAMLCQPRRQGEAVAGAEGLRICHAPPWLPRFHGSPRLDHFTLALRLRAARASLIKAGATHVILYLWRPEFAPALRLVPHNLSCYHIDDEYSFSPSKVEPPAGEMELLRRVGQVFIHSETMLEAKGGINPHTAYLPNGVDYATYSVNADEPADLARIPRPRIGYAGWLKPQLDWDLLVTLAKRHPSWSFVFVGPHLPRPDVEASIEKLSALGNAYFLGSKPTSMLHRYTQHFDVCLMPYEVNWYTQFIYPVKVHEYLATGNAVVAATLPNLAEFHDVVMLARSPDEWSRAIECGLATRRNAALVQARRAVAQRHDWSALAGKAVSILEERLSAGDRP
jgi:glycosyltransferase involved in cell wall biosynthesis